MTSMISCVGKYVFIFISMHWTLKKVTMNSTTELTDIPYEFLSILVLSHLIPVHFFRIGGFQ